jgi:hypothetical protein
VKRAKPSDKYKHAEKAGKKYMANYCAFGEKEDIFQGFAVAAGQIVDPNEEEEDSEDDDDDDESGSDDEEKDEDEENSKRRSRYNFTSLEDRIRFAKESGARFYEEAEAKEVDRWEDEEYQSRVSTLSSLTRFGIYN